MVSKIAISNAVDELVEMDFVDYGDYSEFLQIRDSLSRFSVVVYSEKRKRARRAEIGSESAISHLSAALGDPVIIVWSRDMGFIAKVFQDYRLLVISRYGI